MMDPQDFEGGIGEMLQNGLPEEYPDLPPLPERGSTEIRIKSGDGTDDKKAQDYAFSGLLLAIFKQTQTMYGWVRDVKLQSDQEVIALRRVFDLNDFIFNAECLNREARYAEEERRAQRWLAKFKTRSEQLDRLLHEWSEADAYMMQAEIYQTQHGVERAMRLHEKFLTMQQQREDAEMEAPELEPDEYQYFWCRIRQYKIMRESARDKALGHPVHDFTDVKRKLADGENIHNLVSEMAWPWREGYMLGTTSLADGHSWREMMMSMFAQQIPNRQYPQPGYYPQPWHGGPYDQQQLEDDNDGQQDRRRPVVLFGGGKHRQQEENGQKPKNRRRRRRRRSEHR